jgi:hypothetical protein
MNGKGFSDHREAFLFCGAVLPGWRQAESAYRRDFGMPRHIAEQFETLFRS